MLISTTYLLSGEVGLYVESLLGKDNGKNGMGATAGLIHVCGGHRPAETDSS